MNRFGDLGWLIGTGILAVSTLMILLALRSRSVLLTQGRKRRETTWVLVGSLLVLGVMSGGSIWQHRATASFTRAHQELTPTLAHAIPTRVPTPTPTPLPVLSRSITQELSTFCEAITTKDYQTAWGQYTVSFQQQHAQADVFAV